jgi:hypothetical protein
MKEFFGCCGVVIGLAIFVNAGNYFGWGNTIIFCIVVGIAIWAFPKFLKYMEEKNEEEARQRRLEEERLKELAEKREQEAKVKAAEELRQRQLYAEEFNRKSSTAIDQCSGNWANSNNVLPCPDYNDVPSQEKLWKALNEASIPLQNLEDIVAELTSAAKEVK